MSRSLSIDPVCAECAAITGRGDVGGVTSGSNFAGRRGYFDGMTPINDVCDYISCALAHPDDQVASDGFDTYTGSEFLALMGITDLCAGVGGEE